ncbi:MAG: type 4a pilus biogenesis protein PilO [Planctomycetota bacterium]
MKLVLNRKQKAWTIAGVSFALVLACAGVVWVDHGEIEVERKKISDAKSRIQKADATISKLKSVEDRVLVERVRVKEYTKILPLEKDINEFVRRITEFEATSGVEVEVLDDKSARERGKTKTREAFVRIIYKIELLANAAQFLEFTHLFESYDRFVKVTELAIKGGDPKIEKDGTIFPARHKISMVLETYVYTPSNSISQPVEILNADQRISALAEELADVESLELESYDFASAPRRRDPFANPRRSPVESDQIDVESLEKQQALIAELEKELGEILKSAAEEQKEKDVVLRFELGRRIDARAAAFANRLRELDPEKSFSTAELTRKYENQVGKPFAQFLAERPEVAGLDVPLKELEKQLDKMRETYGEGNWADTVALGTALLQSRPEAAPAEMASRFRDVEELMARAQTRLDFARIELAFNGMVLAKDAPERSVVIINGRAFSPGDRFDEALVVKDVRPTEVAFIFRGEELLRRIDD